ncbi:MAG: hypothetical protein ABF330_10235 [Lentimonas sp.]
MQSNATDCNHPTRLANSLSRLVLLSLALSLPVAASSTLQDKSPFLPPGHNKPKVAPPPPVKTNGPLSREIEFRGVVELEGTYRFSLFNKSDQKGYWIKQGSSKKGISVSNFDLENMSITIAQNGRSERLTLMESTDIPLPVVASAPPKKSKTNQALPSGIQVTNSGKATKGTVPRRRVILPKK